MHTWGGNKVTMTTIQNTSFQNRNLMTLSWCQHEPEFFMLHPARWRHLVRQKLRRCGRLVRLYVHEMAVMSR